jgi:pimeloyl-ACP methyl ester carboxylesterase
MFPRYLAAIVDSQALQQRATLVAVDLPGFGGSDSFPHYGATEVCEALTEFIVATREQYLDPSDADSGRGDGQGDRVFIVGHDWGCLLACRLAAEAPCLANRFVVTNAPHVNHHIPLDTSADVSRFPWLWQIRIESSPLVRRC